MEQQLSFLENMPLEQQLVLLDQALAEYENAAELHDQMVDSYLHGDLQALSARANSTTPLLSETLINARRIVFMDFGIRSAPLRVGEF